MTVLNIFFSLYFSEKKDKSKQKIKVSSAAILLGSLTLLVPDAKIAEFANSVDLEFANRVHLHCLPSSP